MAAVNKLARDYACDVSVDGTTWVRVKGVNNLNPTIDRNLEDSSTYDSNGWSSSEVTMNSWSLQLGVNRLTDLGVEDPAQVLIRAAMDQFGDAARLYVRWFRKDGLNEARSGRAIVGATPDDTAVTSLASLSVTFTGDGILSTIANPYSPTAVPVVMSATPSAVAVGGQVTITGQNFTGTVPTTGVKFGATNATSWVVLGDSTIVAVMPAGSAGSAAITVTNATGPTSPTFPYVRGA